MNFKKEILTICSTLGFAFMYAAPAFGSVPIPQQPVTEDPAGIVTPEDEALLTASRFNDREVYFAKLYIKETDGTGALVGYARNVVKNFKGVEQQLAAIAVTRSLSMVPYSLTEGEQGLANELSLRTADIDFIYASSEMHANKLALQYLRSVSDDFDTVEVNELIVQEKNLTYGTYREAKEENNAICAADPVMDMYACHH